MLVLSNRLKTLIESAIGTLEESNELIAAVEAGANDLSSLNGQTGPNITISAGNGITVTTIPNSIIVSNSLSLASVGSTPSANGASITNAILTLQPFDSTHPGVVSASGGGSVNFLRADGTWVSPTNLYFVSSELTGTSSVQTIPHNLGVVPSAAVVSVTDNTSGNGKYIVTEGTHTSSNLLITIDSGYKYKVIAFR